MRKRIEHIVVLGGGTAGWVAAGVLLLWQRAYPRVRITVVESEQLGVVGTGEGATLLFRSLLASLGVDERDFLERTGATFKLGIRFQDWCGPGTSYLNPFSNLTGSTALDALGRELDYAKLVSIAEGAPNATQFNVQCELMRRGCAPYVRELGSGALRSIEHVGQIDEADLESIAGWGYSYHFDGKAVGAFLKQHALRAGVRCVDAQVVGVDMAAESGNVEALRLDDGRRLEADFFADCSGFHRAIIGRQYREPWRSYKAHLLNDAALPFLLPRDSARVPSYTQSVALSSGWMWQIPLQHRTGCGYVYSKAFLDAEGAQREVEMRLGHAIEPIKNIQFDPGRFERHWIRNCVAIGLASNFSEPLEATSIHATILQVQLLAAYLEEDFDCDATPLLTDYNRRINAMLDQILDFLALHYRTPREDSAYWRALKHDVPLPPDLDHRLSVWKHKLPSDLDFAGLGGHASFTTVSYLYVMDGLGLLDPNLARRDVERSGLSELAKRQLGRIQATSKRLCQRAVDHAEFLALVTSGSLSRALPHGAPGVI